MSFQEEYFKEHNDKQNKNDKIIACIFVLEGENRMEIKDVVGWIVALVVAIIGVSSIVIKRNQKISNRNMKNTMNQTITNGDNNVQAGGDVNRNV